MFNDRSPEALAKIAERRRHARVPVGLKAAYWAVRDRRLQEGMLVTENASGGGLLFRSDGAFQVGMGVRLEMRLPEHTNPVRVHARVVRVEPDPRSPEVKQVALSFTRIENSDRKRLMQCLVARVFTPKDLAIIRAE